MNAPTPTTLVLGADIAAREAAIAARLPRDVPTAIILEGIPTGGSPLDEAMPSLHVARIAPACLCCTGNLTLRVTLNRLLRQRPQRLFISLANAEHLERLRAFLAAPPYDALLVLTQDLHA
ncbi:GTPase [Oxalobacteraceae bacterium OM1]|nr:GTPase [Oxalobacteraceae bacterium OM1]